MDELGSSQPRTASSPVLEAAAGTAGSRGWLRKRLPWLLRSLGLLVLVGLAFFGVDIVGGLELMLHARPAYLIPAFAVFCAALLLRMVVWIILARVLNLGYRRLRSYVRIFFIGWSAGLGLPQGASTVGRAAVLAADKRSVGRGVVVDAADRMLQAASFAVLLLASATYLSTESTKTLRTAGISVAILVGAIPLMLAAAWLLRPLLRRIRSYRWINTFVEDVITTLKELRHTRPSVLAGILALAMVSSLLIVTSLFLTSRSIDIGLSYPVLMAAFAVVGMTTLFPISINGLGPREGILVAAVAGSGFNSEAGVALGLLWFVMQTVTRLAAAASWLMDSSEVEIGTAVSEGSQTESG